MRPSSNMLWVSLGKRDTQLQNSSKCLVKCWSEKPFSLSLEQDARTEWGRAPSDKLTWADTVVSKFFQTVTTGYCSKFAMGTKSLAHHNDPLWWGLSFSPLYRWGNWDQKRSHALPKVLQLINGMGTQTQPGSRACSLFFSFLRDREGVRGAEGEGERES